MPRPTRLLMTALLLFACHPVSAQTSHLPTAPTLPEARKGFATNIVVKRKNTDPVPQPPAGFQLISYPAPLGDFPAYITRPATPGRHPAIIWIAGGFDNSIGDTPWAPATPDNDQSARAFPQAGVITMYPSLRGGNNNPGSNETLYGEVDDVLAAAKYLAGRPDVDPARVYLGGHSTGGTLALLAAESTRGFRAVFAFGPVTSVGLYGKDNLTFDDTDKMELFLRSPVVYLNTISSPTFVFEGTESPGNSDSLHKLARFSKDPQIHFYDLPGLNHFSALAPITPVIAGEIMADSGPQPHFSFLINRPKITPVGP